MNEWVKVIILGIVEGVTEFLPISSTGHLIVTSRLLNFQNSLDGTFELFIQLGAIIAVIVYYRAEIIHQVKTVPSDVRVRKFWAAIIIAFLPAVAVGLLFGDFLQELLFRPVVVAVALIAGGVVFLVIERWRQPMPEDMDATPIDITFRQALLIGLAQLTAFIPGVSRSGASIIGGLLAGLNRKAATQFSFYLAIPTLGGATIYDFLHSLDQIDTNSLAMLLVGTFISGVVAWLSIGWLLRYISTNTFVIFGYYRIGIGIIILILIAAQIL